MRIISYNINGIKKLLKIGKNQTTLDSFLSIEKKPTFQDLFLYNDILLIQETKLNETDNIDLSAITKYYPYFCLNINKSTKKAYSGVALFSKFSFLRYHLDFELASIDLQQRYKSFEFSREGRLQTIEYLEFYVINVYSPNSKKDFSRLQERCIWENLILEYIFEIQTFNKPIIFGGDFNVSLECSYSYFSGPGLSKTEKDCLLRLMKNTNLSDVFTPQYSSSKYSHWYPNMKCGSRFDFFLCSLELISKVEKCVILDPYKESDHKPVLLELNLTNEIKDEIKDEGLSLTLIKKFINKLECKSLFDTISNSSNFKNSHKNKDGKLSKRRNKIIYGSIDKYVITYNGKKIISPVLRWDPKLEELAKKLSVLTNETYNTCVVQYYNNGDVGIKPHRDKEVGAKSHIVSLSLGETRTMRFENGKKKIDIKLEEGTVCIINPPTNNNWLHSILLDETKHPRISLIFRNF